MGDRPRGGGTVRARGREGRRSPISTRRRARRWRAHAGRRGAVRAHRRDRRGERARPRSPRPRSSSASSTSCSTARAARSARMRRSARSMSRRCGTRRCGSTCSARSIAAITRIPAIVRAGGGAVVNMSSGAALRGASPAHIYTAAKGGILSLTRALAGTYARDNVRVNAICAGRILTERILSRYGTPDASEARRGPAGRRAREGISVLGRHAGGHREHRAVPRLGRVAHDHRRRDSGGWRPVGVSRPRHVRAAGSRSAATDASRACGRNPTAGQGTRARPRACTEGRAASARAPCGDLRQAGENAEIADAVERIEIAEHRAEHRSTRLKRSPSNHGLSGAPSTRANLSRSARRLGVERGLVRRAVERPRCR